MPQPLFIQCLTLNFNNDTEQDDPQNTNVVVTPQENEIDRFFDEYEAKLQKTYNTKLKEKDIKAEPARFDIARLPGAQQTIRYIVDTWHKMLTTRENNPENEINTRIFKDKIKNLPLPRTQPQYFWTTKSRLVKKPHIVKLRIDEYLYQEMLETMHTKFHALDKCHAPDCDHFFIQQGRKDRQMFCSNRCKNRVHKRKSRNVNPK